MAKDKKPTQKGKTNSGRPARKPFLLRLSPDLMDELRGWANHDLRSLNGHIEFLLREAVRRRKGRANPDKEEPS